MTRRTARGWLAWVTAVAVGAAACSDGSAARPAATTIAAPSASGPSASGPSASASASVSGAPVPSTSSPPPVTVTPTSLASAPVAVASLEAVPGTPSALAAALAATEAAVRDPATPLSAVPGLGATEQRLVATLASHPEWTVAVTAALPGSLRPAVAGAVGGDRELSAVPGATPTDIPPWTIAGPLPADELLADYRQASTATGVPWTVLAAIHLVETRMGRIVGPSSAGAQGPMQFLPATWAAYGAGGDIHDAHDAVAAAARLLRANGAPRDLARALYHYNPSTSYGRGVLDFASVMAADVRAFYAFYGWRVYVTTTAGTFFLPTGYRHP